MGIAAARVSRNSTINRNTVNLRYRHYRDLIFESTKELPWFKKSDGPIQIDQSYYGRRLRRRGPTGGVHWSKNKMLVIGIRQETSPKVYGDIYTQVIPRGDKATLIPLIEQLIESGATIHTDGWSTFDCLTSKGYIHKRVIHAREYKSKEGVHVNGVETFWSHSKRLFKLEYRGVQHRLFWLHLKEYEFRFNQRADVGGALDQLIKRHSLERSGWYRKRMTINTARKLKKCP